MATDDRFRQYSEAGEEFLEAARSRAVEFLRELGRAGQTTQKQASDQVEDLVEAGRKGTDQILDVIRKEIASQLGALGLATKDDLAALERRVKAAPATAGSSGGRKAASSGGRKAASSGGRSAAPAAKKASPAKAGAAKAAGAAKSRASSATSSTSTTAAKAAAPAKKTARKAAGAAKSGAKQAPSRAGRAATRS